MAELAPAELAQKGAGRAPQARRLLLVPPGGADARPRSRGPASASVAGDGVPHLARRHLSPAQVGREPRGALRPRGVAVRSRSRRARRRGSSRGARARPPRPGARRRRTPAAQGRMRLASPASDEGEAAGGSAGAGGSARRAPADGSSGAPAARRARQNGVKTVYGRPSPVRGPRAGRPAGCLDGHERADPAGGERRPHGGVVRGLVRLEAARPHHGVGAGPLAPARPRRRPGRRASTDESRAETTQVRVQARERVPEPPARRRRPAPRRGARAAPTRTRAGGGRRRPARSGPRPAAPGCPPGAGRGAATGSSAVCCRGRSRSSGLLGSEGCRQGPAGQSALVRGRVVTEYDRRPPCAIAAAASSADGRDPSACSAGYTSIGTAQDGRAAVPRVEDRR